ncbi:pyrroloquinoline quinone biosynthesis protein PqqB [Myxococcota bacterium]|nr:pyrroloquinoline quinone biosynthesis protein PqqB [Myxococcota bacterium]
MKIRILGSCAGGGLPQWNCGGEYSVRARADDPAVPSRTQPSLAVSADGERWCVINASPDIRQQMTAFPPLHPEQGTRDVPLDTVLLTSAELDHAMGLLILREALSYRILSTPWVRASILEHNSAFRLLESVWEPIEVGKPLNLDSTGRLQARLFPVAPKIPPYLRGIASAASDTTVGLRLTDTSTGRRLVFVPGMKSLTTEILKELEQADCRIVDGTFSTADELLAMRPGAPDAVAMGHMPILGSEGSLEALQSMEGRSLYIHMNNTNPILDSHSEATAAVRAAGVEIAQDGMEFEL